MIVYAFLMLSSEREQEKRKQWKKLEGRSGNVGIETFVKFHVEREKEGHF